MKFLGALCFCLILIMSCGSGGGCEMNYDNSKSIGSIALDSESLYWMPETDLDSLYFKNNKGAHVSFFINRYSSNYDNKYELYRNNDLSGGPCVTKGYVYVYGEKLQVRLNSLELPYSIRLNRVKNIEEYKMPDTTTLDDLKIASDKIMVSLGYDGNSFVVRDTSKNILGDVFLVDSLYRNVYRIEGNNEANPKGTEYFYFQRGKGLMGFKLLNGETWARY